MRKKILIVEDIFVEANNIQIILEKAGYDVVDIAASYDKAMAALEKDLPDLVLIDIFLTGERTGIDLAHQLNIKDIAFVYLSANSNPTTLLAAKATQPYGFLVKPFREKDILVTLDIALYLHEQKRELRQRAVVIDALQQVFRRTDIVGNSASLKDMLRLVEIVAATDTTVLILGESGTGKERVADAIHANSSRRSQPFIKVNCAALPENLIESELFGHERGAFTDARERRIGKFEQANRGTIFLDEIGEMPLHLQTRLLRVLQEKEIDRLGGKDTVPLDIRIIAATNKNLEQQVQERRFRMDLYYRLNVFPIEVPPLRQRAGDTAVLAAHFVRLYCAQNRLAVKTLSEKALKVLAAYPWPGNVRELQHLMERTVLLNRADVIAEIDLPAAASVGGSGAAQQGIKTMEEIEIEHIRSVLALCKGKLSGPGGAAEMLKMPYSTLVSRMQKLGIRSEKRFN